MTEVFEEDLPRVIQGQDAVSERRQLRYLQTSCGTGLACQASILPNVFQYARFCVVAFLPVPESIGAIVDDIGRHNTKLKPFI